MAASQIPVPLALETGAYQDFINGIKEAHDTTSKAVLEAAATGLAAGVATGLAVSTRKRKPKGRHRKGRK